MPVHSLQITIQGVLEVEAITEKEAQQLVEVGLRMGKLTLAGKQVQNATVVLTPVKKLDDHFLKPQSLRIATLGRNPGPARGS